MAFQYLMENGLKVTGSLALIPYGTLDESLLHLEYNSVSEKIKAWYNKE